MSLIKVWNNKAFTLTFSNVRGVTKTVSSLFLSSVRLFPTFFFTTVEWDNKQDESAQPLKSGQAIGNFGENVDSNVGMLSCQTEMVTMVNIIQAKYHLF